MKTIYIVFGYMKTENEEQEWPVAVYPDQETAEQHCKLAQEAINKAINEHGSSRKDIRIPYDKKRFYWFHTNISYYVKETIFARHVDEYLDLIQE